MAEHDEQDLAAVEADEQQWLTPGVAGVGASSFFSDSGHEITTAVLPSFLTGTLHAGAGALGLIDGASDALIARQAGRRAVGGRCPVAGPVGTGRIPRHGSTRRGNRPRRSGLAGSASSRGVLDRTRAAFPSRDALLATLAPRSGYGRAYGLERAGDNAGALVGPLLAALTVVLIGVRPILLIAAVPGVFAAIAITIAAREAGRAVAAPAGRRRISLNISALHQHGLIRALLPAAPFECGNVATTLMILRATDLLRDGGRGLAAATSLAIPIYAAHNAVAAVAALAGGALIDRLGSRAVFAAGAAAYVLAYAAFATGIRAWAWLLIAFCLAGIGIGLAETAQSTLVAHALPDRLRGSGFGLLGVVRAGGDLVSSAVVGVLWAALSPVVGFAYAAAWMAASLIAAIATVGTRQVPSPSGQINGVDQPGS